jgi:hypothetical protein
LAGKTTKAMASFHRGLELAPRHKGLIAEYKRVDRRDPPPLSIVSRNHPVNKLLGKLRASLRNRAPRRVSVSDPS